MVSSVLGAALAVVGELDGPVRWLVVLVRYYGLKVDEAADCLGLDAEKARELHEGAVLAVYDGMLRAAV